jgi:hypothetical protein
MYVLLNSVQFVFRRRLRGANETINKGVVAAGSHGYGFPPHGMTGTVDMLFAGAPSISLRLMAR